MSRAEIVPRAPLGDIAWVTSHLRPLDQLECDCQSAAGDGPLEWAARIEQATAMRWVAKYRGRPAAVYGVAERWPGTFSAFQLTTEDFPHVAYSVARHWRLIFPTMFANGAQRIDVQTLAHYREGMLWCEFLGAQEEAVLENWGKNGETFVQYCWLREAYKPTERTAVADERSVNGLPVL